MVQQPTGQAPQFLVLAEIQRRKDMRESAQPAPESTVADDLEQQGLAALQPPPQEEAGPEQMDAGVAALPTDMPEAPQSMAGGGIIAFDEGGDVPSFAGPRGSYVVGPDPDALLKSYRGRLAGEEQRYATDRPEFGLGQITAYAQHENALAKLKQAAKTPYDPAIAYYDSIGDLQGKMMAQEKRADWLANPTNLMENAVSVSPAKPSAVPVPPNRTGYIPAGPSAGPNLNAVNAVKPVQAPAAGPFTYTDLPSADAQFDKLIRPERSAEEHANELNLMIGENTGITALKDKLAGMEERDKTTAEDAPWMALMRAGLGMAAGTSPFALSNIASGGIEGLKDYAAIKDKLSAAEEKRFEIQSRIAESERNEQVMAAKHGIDSAQADKAAAETQRLKQIEANQNRDIANKAGRFEAQKANVDADFKRQQLENQRLEINKPSADIQLLNDLKNPNNAKVYAETIGGKQSGAITESSLLKTWTDLNGLIGTGMTFDQFKKSFMGSGASGPREKPIDAFYKK